MNRSLLWLVGLTVLVGSGLLFLLRGGEGAGAGRASQVAVAGAVPVRESGIAAAALEEEPRASEAAVSAERTGVIAPMEAMLEPEVVRPLDGGEFQRDAIYGRCIGSNGEAIVGARVEAFEVPGGNSRNWSWRRSGELSQSIASSETDAGGRFRLQDCTPFTDYALAATAEGHGPIYRTVEPGEDIELVLPAECVVAGRVLRRGSQEGLAGASLSVSAGLLVDGVYSPDRTTSTDSDGGFRFSGLSSGKALDFEVDHRDHLARSISVTLPEGEAAQLEFELDRGRPAEVVFVDLATGRGVGGAELKLGHLSLGRSDEAGRLLLRIPGEAAEAEGSFSLRASADGYCDAGISVTGEELLSLTDFRIPLLVGAQVSGVVTDPEGEPLEGVFVYTRGRNRVDPLGRSPMPGVAFHQPSGQAVRTDASGAFHCSDLVPGERGLNLTLEHPGFVTQFESVVLSQPGQHEVLELIMEPAGEIRGTVTSAGVGVEAQIEIQLTSSDQRRPRRHQSNDAGEFRIGELAPGEYGLGAKEPKSYSFSQEFEPQVVRPLAAGEVLIVDLNLDAVARGEISGLVFESDGTPAPRVDIHGFAHTNGKGEFVRTVSDEAGRWTLDVVDDPELLYQVTANDESRSAVVRDVQVGTKDLELRFEPRGEIRLTAVDTVSQRRLEQVNVKWREEGTEDWKRLRGGGFGRSSAGAPEPDGAFRLALAPGVVDLRVDYEPGNYLPSELLGVTVPSAEQPLELQADLVRGAELSLTFVASGELAALPQGAFLLGEGQEVITDPMELYQATRSNRGPRSIRTRGGRAQLKAVPNGRYRIAHPRADIVFEPAELTITGPDKLEVEVRFTGDPTVEDSGNDALDALEMLGYF